MSAAPLEYVLDTDTVSEPVRPRPDPVLAARVEREVAHCCLASVTWYELRYGVARLPHGSRRAGLAEWLAELDNRLTVLPYDAVAARWHAEQRARLERTGTTPPFADGQVAAVAAVRGLTLVTRNTKHHAGWTGLQVEDWSGS